MLFQGFPPIYAVKRKQKFSVWFNDVTAQLTCNKSLHTWILTSKFITGLYFTLLKGNINSYQSAECVPNGGLQPCDKSKTPLTRETSIAMEFLASGIKNFLWRIVQYWNKEPETQWHLQPRRFSRLDCTKLLLMWPSINDIPTLCVRSD